MSTSDMTSASNARPRIQFLSAGAGSGKTYRLTETLKERLQEGKLKPGGILATTFTRKAATELRERVREHLLKAGSFELANAVAEAQIGTVNAVCGSLVKRFSFEMGLSPDLRVLEEEEASRLLSESLDRVIETGERRRLSDLSWRLSVEDDTNAIRELVQLARANGLQPDQVVEMGRINAAAQVDAICLPPAGDVSAQLAATIDRHLPALIAALNTTKPKRNTETYLTAVQLFRGQMENQSAPWADWARVSSHAPPEKSLREVANDIAQAAERFVHHPQFAKDIRDYLELVFKLAGRTMVDFTEQKARQGVIDFVDQEALLLQHLDHQLVQEALKDELQLVVVDEFQDTSPLQLAIFLKLAEISPESIWVGDIKQAIYGFRGTDTRLMQAVIAALPELGGSMERMNDSWRSRPALVDLCNRVYTHAFRESLSKDDVALNPRRAEPLPDATAYEVWHLSDKNKDLRRNALIVQLIALKASERQLVDKSSNTLRPLRWKDIAILVNQNAEIGELALALRTRGIPCAVETYGLLAQPESVLALACLRRLYDERDTLATAEILSLAACQPAEQWLQQRLELLNQLQDEPELGHLWGEIDLPGHPPHPLLSNIAGLRPKLNALTPREALANLMAVADFGQVVTAWSRDRDQALARLSNLDALLDLAGRYEDECTQRDAPGSIPGLLFWLSKLQAEKKDMQARPDTDAITVMTHHGAKGLEWPVVVLLDLGAKIKDDLWSIRAEQLGPLDIHQPLASRFIRYWVNPFGSKLTNVSALRRVEGSQIGAAAHQRALEERRRLLYVSMTRPRDLLILGVEQTDFDKLNWLSAATEFRQLLETSEPNKPVLPADWNISNRFISASLDEDRSTQESQTSFKPRFWPAKPTPVAERIPLFINPSSAEPIPAKVSVKYHIATPLELLAEGRASEVGSAIHAALAYGLSAKRDPDIDVLRQLVIRLDCARLISAEAMQRLIIETRAGLNKIWPGAQAVAEVPFSVSMTNGQIMRGQIDLLLTDGDAHHVVDHKSGQLETPAGGTKWHPYLGQLEAYASLVGKGDEVGRWLYSLRSGELLQLAAQNSDSVDS